MCTLPVLRVLASFQGLGHPEGCPCVLSMKLLVTETSLIDLCHLQLKESLLKSLQCPKSRASDLQSVPPVLKHLCLPSLSKIDLPGTLVDYSVESHGSSGLSSIPKYWSTLQHLSIFNFPIFLKTPLVLTLGQQTR